MDVFNIIVGIIGFILSMLMAIIGYFLRQQIAVIASLNKTVVALISTVAVLENDNKNSIRTCSANHALIDKRFDSHSRRIGQTENKLDDIDKDVAVLTEKVKKNE